ncbi:hypothetical protein WM42_0549 [Corynebacterium simulans]|uniref:hypothetical protein n=1 Tax=Corynebacterium TaxID=1716 RepID=UPI0007839339|nr:MULTISPECIES: hypothetical protein [Corynebacterium]AMO88299.1 hypothetical protein WM42_0549 [Corynebacterium simulans]OFT49054.1 hypothetical protein HMPREF3158_00925 [Corynebacterium sp. HMSC06G04]
MTYPYPQQKDKSGVVPIVVGIVILVAIVAAAAAFFLLSRGDDKTEQTAQQEFKPVESTSAPAETTSVAPSTKESPSQSVVTVTETAPNPEEHYDHGRDKSTVSGGILSDRGWSGSYASCTAGEDLILAGTSDDGKVVVCGNAGGATYRSDMFGGTLELPAEGHEGTYQVDADPSYIVVNADGLRVYQDNTAVESVTWNDYWQR